MESRRELEEFAERIARDDLQEKRKIRREIDSTQTENGGWTKETLANWGIPWPPPKGWKKILTK